MLLFRHRNTGKEAAVTDAAMQHSGCCYGIAACSIRNNKQKNHIKKKGKEKKKIN